ncbi:hypothetical protein GW17_00061408, partial [Ensete ventricosum]
FDPRLRPSAVCAPNVAADTERRLPAGEGCSRARFGNRHADACSPVRDDAIPGRQLLLFVCRLWIHSDSESS